MFAHVRKLVVGLVGLVLLLVYQHFGLDLSGQSETIVGIIIAAGAAFGIWVVPNEPG